MLYPDPEPTVSEIEIALVYVIIHYVEANTFTVKSNIG